MLLADVTSPELSWLPLIQALGVPGFVLAMFAYAGWKVIPWCGEKCIVPIVNRHVQFVDGVQDTLVTVAQQFQEAGSDLKRISEAQAKLAEAQAKLAESQARFSDDALETLKAAKA